MRRPASLVFALALSSIACGRVGYDRLATSSDAGAEASSDSWSDLGRFSAPQPLLGLEYTPPTDDDPTLTGDQLEIYFESERPGTMGNGDIWRSTRAAVTDRWNAPAPVAELATPSDDGSPGITSDGLVLAFSSERPSTLGGSDLFITSRASRDGAWSAPTHLLELNSTSQDTGPALSPDGLVIVFHSLRRGSEDIFIAIRPSRDASFGAPLALDEVNGPTRDTAPHLVGDVLVFGSDRAGTSDLWVSVASGMPRVFGPPRPIAELSSHTRGEDDPWISPDLRTIYFVADGATILSSTR